LTSLFSISLRSEPGGLQEKSAFSLAKESSSLSEPPGKKNLSGEENIINTNIKNEEEVEKKDESASQVEVTVFNTETVINDEDRDGFNAEDLSGLSFVDEKIKMKEKDYCTSLCVEAISEDEEKDEYDWDDIVVENTKENVLERKNERIGDDDEDSVREKIYEKKSEDDETGREKIYEKKSEDGNGKEKKEGCGEEKNKLSERCKEKKDESEEKEKEEDNKKKNEYEENEEEKKEEEADEEKNETNNGYERNEEEEVDRERNEMNKKKEEVDGEKGEMNKTGGLC
jgi:hypothetical protein